MLVAPKAALPASAFNRSFDAKVSLYFTPWVLIGHGCCGYPIAVRAKGYPRCGPGRGDSQSATPQADFDARCGVGVASQLSLDS